MGDLERFILENEEAETSRLLLSCRQWPSLEGSALSVFDGKELVINTIESRRKLKDKVPEWYSLSSLVYPSSLSAEQCSSSVTARYKASLANRILDGVPGRIADLTGGLGVDCWAFSEVASEVLYNERNTFLVEAARHNFAVLGRDNIRLSNEDLGERSAGAILNGFRPDLIFLDPARRDSDGGKVFLLEDCSPNILALVPDLFGYSRHILLKLSPMADLSMAIERLNRSYESHLESLSGSGWNGNWVREVHVVASGGECKELLVWMDREWRGEYSVTCREDGGTLTFTLEEIAHSKAIMPDSATVEFLFEPGKSLLKAGVFNALCERFSLVRLARFTHLYTFGKAVTEEEALSSLGDLAGMGKLYRIEEVARMSKSSFKDIGRRFPRSEVSARNIPLTSAELRSKLGVRSGDDAHIFGVRIETPFESSNFLLVGHRI